MDVTIDERSTMTRNHRRLKPGHRAASWLRSNLTDEVVPDSEEERKNYCNVDESNKTPHDTGRNNSDAADGPVGKSVEIFNDFIDHEDSLSRDLGLGYNNEFDEATLVEMDLYPPSQLSLKNDKAISELVTCHSKYPNN